MSANATRTTPQGGKLQSGIPRRRRMDQGLRAYGLMLKGVVLKTYGVLDDNHPYAIGVEHNWPVAAYCDVLTYSGRPNVQWRILRNVLVSQPWGGCHTGTNWSPRPTTINIAGDDLDTEMRGMSPGDLDGDHVLVGFVNDSLNEPVIIRSIPHPNLETGVEFVPGGAGGSMDHPLRPLVLFPGEARRMFGEKFQGSGWQIDVNGEIYLNSMYAYGEGNDLGDTGVEPVDESWHVESEINRGHQNFMLPDDGEVRMLWLFRDRLKNPVFDGDPDPVVAGLEHNRYRVSYRWNNRDWAGSALENAPGFGSSVDDDAGGPNQNQFSFSSYGENARFTLGDGAVHVAIVEELRALYLDLKAKLDAFEGHTHLYEHPVHVSGTVATQAPDVAIDAPDWENAIESAAVSIPSAHP